MIEQLDLSFTPPCQSAAAARPTHVTVCRVRLADGGRVSGSERQGLVTDWGARCATIRYPSYDDSHAVQSSLFRCVAGEPGYGQRVGDDRESGFAVMAEFRAGAGHSK